jgi:macrodomain Ter protein organizer (MatP/YcbG family)
MPRSDFDFDAYVSELFKDASDLSQEQRAAVVGVLSNEAVKNRLADSVIRQQDYSKQTQELATQRKSLDSERSQLESWYEQQLEQTKRNKEAYDRVQQQLAAYKNQYGDDEVPTTQQQTQQVDYSQFVPKSAMEQELGRVQSDGIRLMAEMNTLQARHLTEFKEPLDMNALTALAAQNGKTLSQQYSESVQERRKAIQDAEIQKRIDEAREEGRKSALSASRIPTMPTGVDSIHPIEARQALGDKSNIPAWKRGVADFLEGKL